MGRNGILRAAVHTIILFPPLLSSTLVLLPWEHPFHLLLLAYRMLMPSSLLPSFPKGTSRQNLAL
jgi:hypothetical protein